MSFGAALSVKSTEISSELSMDDGSICPNLLDSVRTTSHSSNTSRLVNRIA